MLFVFLHFSLIVYFHFFFFFSSRRRHTRFDCDWSSDVCSSDLLRFPGRPSYTVDTLRELRGELGPSRPLAWLVGADSLLGLTRWHEWEALFGLAHFVVAERPGSPLQASVDGELGRALEGRWADNEQADRKSTRLNSSHSQISYAVFCLKKKNYSH